MSSKVGVEKNYKQGEGVDMGLSIKKGLRRAHDANFFSHYLGFAVRV